MSEPVKLVFGVGKIEISIWKWKDPRISLERCLESHPMGDIDPNDPPVEKDGSLVELHFRSKQGLDELIDALERVRENSENWSFS